MLDSFPHRRYNPLSREWILVSPHRAKRPWQGQIEKPATANLPDYDPTCYLCPGNERAGGIKNPIYKGTFVFDNNFGAILPDTAGNMHLNSDSPTPTPEVSTTSDTLFMAKLETGICRVVCFSPRHNLTLPQLSLDKIEGVINTWSNQTAAQLRDLPKIHYTQR
jgi:UDPglucose--hexose-1-phosphate uridylyltransferase